MEKWCSDLTALRKDERLKSNPVIKEQMDAFAGMIGESQIEELFENYCDFRGWLNESDVDDKFNMTTFVWNFYDFDVYMTVFFTEIYELAFIDYEDLRQSERKKYQFTDKESLKRVLTTLFSRIEEAEHSFKLSNSM